MNLYVDSFLELIYTEKNTCFICESYDESIGDKYICRHCEKLLKKLEPPLCSKCSKPISYGSSASLCPECSGEERYFEMSKSLYSYEGLIKKAIYSYKYYNQPYFYKMFGNMLLTYMLAENYTNFDCIVPVPLHSSKLRTRGYNQSELLARHLSKKLSIPYVDSLKRIKKTAKQSEQSKLERAKNLKDAFAIKSDAEIVVNSSVLLVDDIYTTGATVDECAKALKNRGAANVFVITIAR